MADKFSLHTTSPQTTAWILIVKSAFGIEVFRFAQIFPHKIRDWDLWQINARASTPNTGRFDNQKYTENLSTLNGAVCVKYHTFSNDKNAKIAGGKASMLLESIGYNCQHPINNLVGVNIEYSSRYFETKEKSSLEKDSKAFFSNIEFSEF